MGKRELAELWQMTDGNLDMYLPGVPVIDWQMRWPEKLSVIFHAWKTSAQSVDRENPSF